MALLKIYESISAAKLALRVSAQVTHDNRLVANVTNFGRRPLTLVEVHIGYGSSIGDCDTFLFKEVAPLKLEETDTFWTEIDHDEIIASARKNNLKQRLRSRVFVIATTSTGQRFYSRLFVPHEIIPKECLASARDWIAADLYVGFDQLDSEVPDMPILSLK